MQRMQKVISFLVEDRWAQMQRLSAQQVGEVGDALGRNW